MFLKSCKHSFLWKSMAWQNRDDNITAHSLCTSNNIA